MGKKSFACLSGSGRHCRETLPYVDLLFQCAMNTYGHSPLLAINSPCQLVYTYPPTLPRNSGPDDHISELEERLWNGSRLATLLSLFSEKVWLPCLILLIVVRCVKVVIGLQSDCKLLEDKSCFLYFSCRTWQVVRKYMLYLPGHYNWHGEKIRNRSLAHYTPALSTS